jgi:hypothetical protein
MQTALRLLPIKSCHECGHRAKRSHVCLLMGDKSSKYTTPRKGIPKWCPLPGPCMPIFFPIALASGGPKDYSLDIQEAQKELCKRPWDFV